MPYAQNTYNLNITPLLGEGKTRLLRVEGLKPMTPEEFVDWIFRADYHHLPAPKISHREDVKVWKIDNTSLKDKLAMRQLSDFNIQYKKFKRKYPHKSHEELCKITQEWLDMKAKFLESFVFDLGGALETDKAQGQSKTKAGLDIWTELSQATKTTAIPASQPSQPNSTIKEEKKNEII